MAQMQWQSFTLPRELKRLWKRAARQERISASEFLRRALSERLDRTLPKPTRDVNGGEVRA
jgi:ribbon-helix-helix CopG family protein